MSQSARCANNERAIAERRAEKVSIHSGERLGFDTMVRSRSRRVQRERSQRYIGPTPAQRRECSLEDRFVAQVSPTRRVEHTDSGHSLRSLGFGNGFNAQRRADYSYRGHNCRRLKREIDAGVEDIAGALVDSRARQLKVRKTGLTGGPTR
jgi:hypothetical protein